MAAADAAAVSAFADVTLFLVQWGDTPRTTVATALRFLHLCGTVIDGIILSQVDLRRQEQYDEAYGHKAADWPPVSLPGAASASTSRTASGCADAEKASADSPER